MEMEKNTQRFSSNPGGSRNESLQTDSSATPTYLICLTDVIEDLHGRDLNFVD